MYESRTVDAPKPIAWLTEPVEADIALAAEGLTAWSLLCTISGHRLSSVVWPVVAV